MSATKMKFRFDVRAIAAGWTILFAWHSSSSAAVSFNRDVRPLLSRCAACHGADDEHREGGFSIAERDLAVATLDSGAVGIVPGDPDRSELIVRVSTADEDIQMPPADVGTHLSSDEISILRKWIEEGAAYEQHWSFVPPTKTEAPSESKRGWTKNEIDAFILSRLNLSDLHPELEADRYRLIRRVSLDLIGLPPTVEEVDDFVNDERADAYEHLVDRLLDSPHFGEHWAQMWLDLARYADTQGYSNDNVRIIWPYRDWVVNALNEDMPFDKFTIHQIAGDLLPEPTPSQLIATGFHRNTMTNDEGGTDDEEYRYAAVVDRTNTTMQVWMGLTFACAQCHTHKYDPITHRDYYQLFSFFNQSEDADRQDNSPILQLPTPEQAAELERLQKAIGAGNDKAEDDHSNALPAQVTSEVASTPIMKELSASNRRATHLHIRGAYLDLGDQVAAGVPDKIYPWSSEQPRNRLGLAHWLVDPGNPLTSRVTVNRYWERIFGVGLVETSEDFGTQGAAPSHPELLDWLACDFVEHGWSTKHLVRLLVTSATYRQSSIVTPEKLAADPENRLLSRGARHRLSAEQIRDYALATSGLMSMKIGGPPVRPLQPKLGVNSSFGTSLDWDTSAGDDRYRRSIYTLWRRTMLYPSLAALDAPGRTTCTIRRINTYTPVSVFVTLNDPAFIEAARSVGKHVVAHKDKALNEQVTYAFRRVLSRPPLPAELSRIVEMVTQQKAYYDCHPDIAFRLASDDSASAILNQAEAVNLAAWTMVAHVLLNLDEALTRN